MKKKNFYVAVKIAGVVKMFNFPSKAKQDSFCKELSRKKS